MTRHALARDVITGDVITGAWPEPGGGVSVWAYRRVYCTSVTVDPAGTA